MSDKKISQLTASTTPLAGTEVLPVVQSGATKQVSVANLTAGRNPVMNYALAQTGFQIQTGGVNRWIIEKGAGEGLFIYRYNDAGSYAGNPVQIDRANGNVRLENNLVIGTAGNGIDFSADSSAAGMTSELLDDYEEGTWTPTDGSGAGLTFSGTNNNCFYTKTGGVVTVCFAVTYPSTADANFARIAGLPFVTKNTALAVQGGFFVEQSFSAGATMSISANDSTFIILTSGTVSIATNTDLSAKTLRGVLVYQT
jgi:hypothetical protein